MGTVAPLLTTNAVFFLIFIILQFLVVYGIALAIRWNRFLRKRRNKKKEVLLQIWTKTVTDIALGLTSVNLISKHGKADSKILQDILIEIIRSLHFSSSQPVIQLYKHLGFLDLDHLRLKSVKLERKLKALSHIDLLQDSSSTHFVRHLQFHRNYFVRFSALRFMVRQDMSEVKHLDSEIQVLASKRRFDTILEILTILALHYPEEFQRLFRNNERDDLKKLFLKVTVAHKIKESLEIVRASLEELVLLKNLDVGLVKLHLLCLTFEYSEENERLFRHLSLHQNQEIKYLALCSLLIIRPDLKNSLLEEVSQETKEGLEQAFQNFSLHMGKLIYG